jgi:hypothetical protein
MRIRFTVPIFSILQFILEVTSCLWLALKKAPDHLFYDTVYHTLVFLGILFCVYPYWTQKSPVLFALIVKSVPSCVITPHFCSLPCFSVWRNRFLRIRSLTSSRVMPRGNLAHRLHILCNICVCSYIYANARINKFNLRLLPLRNNNVI